MDSSVTVGVVHLVEMTWATRALLFVGVAESGDRAWVYVDVFATGPSESEVEKSPSDSSGQTLKR